MLSPVQKRSTAQAFTAYERDLNNSKQVFSLRTLVFLRLCSKVYDFYSLKSVNKLKIDELDYDKISSLRF